MHPVALLQALKTRRQRQRMHTPGMPMPVAGRQKGSKPRPQGCRTSHAEIHGCTEATVNAIYYQLRSDLRHCGTVGLRGAHHVGPISGQSDQFTAQSCHK